MTPNPNPHECRHQLRDYLSYTLSHDDDTPLYIFDASFGEARPCFLHDYSSPTLFDEDLMALSTDDDASIDDNETRPPFRWFLLGARGSGTDIHRDPPNTAAWNALLSGRKRWALFPPHLTPEEVVDLTSSRCLIFLFQTCAYRQHSQPPYVTPCIL